VSVEPNESPVLTVAEVAELLKLNQQTVRNWIDAGFLPAVRIGRRVRIKRETYQRLVDGGLDNVHGGVSTPPSGPNADDFWGGEPVGDALPVEPPTPDLVDAAEPPV
jgi:excisionase family DNA binding protein